MLFQQIGKFTFAIIFLLIGLLFTKNQLLPVIVYCCSILILSMISFYVWNRYLSYCSLYNNSFSVGSISYKEILSVSLSMFTATSIFMIMSWMDIIMLGMWRKEEEIGIYNSS